MRGFYINKYISLLYIVDDSLEGICMVHREVGKNFSVESYILFSQQIDELGVGNTFCSGSCFNPGYPKPSECALFVSPVAECIAIGFVNGILRYGKNLRSCAKITFGRFKNFLSSLSGRYCVY